MKLGYTVLMIVCALLLTPATAQATTAQEGASQGPPLCGDNRARVLSATERMGFHYSIPNRLLMGLIWVESDCNPTIRSGAGAIGLMQVMPREIGYQFRDRPTAAQLRDIDTNVAWGTWILYEMDYRYCGAWHRLNPRHMSKAELGYWQCALGAFWGGTQVYFSGRLTPNEQAYADMVIGAAGRVEVR